MKGCMQIENHPFEPWLPVNAHLLMLGTFPPSPKRWCMPWYYPNFQNDMWRIFGILKPNGYRQFNTAYIEIPKKMGKSELAAAVALLLTCGDGEERAEVYGCAAERQQATIVFDVAADMVRMCPALNRRVKILASGIGSTLAISHLTPGAYIVKARTNTDTTTIKFIK